MAIQNGLGITGYDRKPARGYEGSWADAEGGRARPMILPLVAQIMTLVVGTWADDADTFTVHIDKPDGTRVSSTVTRVAGVPTDAAAAAAAMVVAINAQAGLKGHVIASAVTTTITLTFTHPNVVYPVSVAATGVTITGPTTTQTAGGTAVTVGRFVGWGNSTDGQPIMRALVAADDEWAIAGIALRTLDQSNAGSPLATSVDQVAAGRMHSAAYKGNVYMKNTGLVASTPNGQVFVVVETTGGGEIGTAMAAASGSAALFTATPVAVNDQEYGLAITWRGVTYTEIVQADGSATATEIADAFRTRFGTIAGITFGGTATLTILGAAGEPLLVNDLGPGDMGVVATTASDPYVIAIDRKRAAWAEVVAPGEIGPVHLDLAG